MKKVFLCQNLLFIKVGSLTACNFIKKETVAQMFSCEFREISKNTILHRTRLVAASVFSFVISSNLSKMFVRIGGEISSLSLF